MVDRATRETRSGVGAFLALAASVALLLAPGDALAAPGTDPAAVIACPLPAAQHPGISIPLPAPIPHSTSLPSGVSLPAGAVVYGTTLPQGTPGALLKLTIAPDGYSCQPILSLEGGGTTVTLSDPAQPGQRVLAVSAGSVGTVESLSCPYIPAVRAADAAHPYFVGCSAPPQDVVKLLPTGSRSLLAAAVRVPAGFADPNVPTTGKEPDSTLAVFTAELAGAQNVVGAQEIACTLPAQQEDVCAAALSFFLADSAIGTRLDPGQLRSALAGLQAFLPAQHHDQAQECSSGGVRATYEPPWVTKLNDQLHAKAHKHLPVSVATIRLPAGLFMNLAPSFQPNEATICANGLADGGLFGEQDPWENNLLSMEARPSTGIENANRATLGPFTYSADATAWINAPGVAESERKTTFQPEAKLLPPTKLNFTSRGLDVEVPLAELEFAAVRSELRLVSNGHEVLAAGLAPTLSLELTVSKRNLLDDLAEKAQETDLETAERELAREVADDVRAAAESEGEGFYGLSSAQIEAKLGLSTVQDLQSQLVDELGAEINSLRPGSADAAELRGAGVTPDEVPPEAAAALEAEGETAAGGDAVVTIACVLLFGGPEDPLGDALCLR